MLYKCFVFARKWHCYDRSDIYFRVIENNTYIQLYILDLTHCGFNPYNAELFLYNPLSPHDALKHHFISLKTDLILL